MKKELELTKLGNINIDLIEGVITLRSGSKVYIPNGFEDDGVTLKFDEVDISTDVAFHSGTIGSATGEYMLLSNSIGHYGYRAAKSECCSGIETPGSGYSVWYDTGNNVIKYSENKDGVWVIPLQKWSLPFANYQRTNGVATKILEVFDGYGYIGDVNYIFPGISGIIPKGFNSNGEPLFINGISNALILKENKGGGVYLVYTNGVFTDFYFSNEIKYNPFTNSYIGGKDLLLMPFVFNGITIEIMKQTDAMLISQYANSPVLKNLASGLNTLFDDSEFVKNWYETVFNLETATGYGLDVWGKILNVGRTFVYNGISYYLGGAQIIDGVSFTAEQMDNLYRQVLQLTAMRYIGNASIASINNMLQFIYGGKCYCLEYDVMEIRYVFRFYMNKIQKAIIETLNPHPTGVLTSFEYLEPGKYFGFDVQIDGDEPWTPFDNGPFYR
ncbi:MAG: DUF2612 domain-containing protein [Methanobrevibacter sp.]|nr:DUF2612 domain-containing protein [Methanobrevibacter sp.]